MKNTDTIMKKQMFAVFPEKFPDSAIATSLISAFEQKGFFVSTDFEMFSSFGIALFFGFDENILETARELFFKNPETIFIFFLVNAISKETCLELESFCGKKLIFSSVPDNLGHDYDYLPTGVDISRYKPDASAMNPVINIVGAEVLPDFVPYLAAITEAFKKNPLNIMCDENNFDKLIETMIIKGYSRDTVVKFKSTEHEPEKRLYDRNKLFSTAFANIVPYNPAKTDFELREVLASGGFALVQNNPFVRTAGVPGKDFDTFDSPEDLIDKLEFFMKNPHIAFRMRELAVETLLPHISGELCVERMLTYVKKAFDE